MPEGLWPPHLTASEQVAIAREAHRAHDVRDAGRLHDEGRVHVDGFVQHVARRVVARIPGEEQGPAQARLEIRKRGLFDDCRRAVELDGGEAARGLRRGLVEGVQPRHRQRVSDGGSQGRLEEVTAVHAASTAAVSFPLKAERSSRIAA